MSLTVIKVGGSLLEAGVLPEWLNVIHDYASSNQVVMVPGGGQFADTVRKLHARHEFDEAAAHRMALLSMCQYGYVISDLRPDFSLTESVQLSLSEHTQPPYIWLPYALVNSEGEIPASWDYTSDSIALWLAIQLNAERLCLIKSTQAESDTSDLNSFVKSEKIDKGFQSFVSKYLGKIYYFNQTEFTALTDSSVSEDSRLVV